MKGADKNELGRRERKKQITREAILKTAQELFNKKGFENTSVEELTERVDIAQSTFFNYFPRKEDILTEIFHIKLPFLKKKCGEVLLSNDPFKIKIRQIFSSMVSIVVKNENITRAMLIHTMSSPPDRNYNELFFDEFRKILSLVLKKGQEEGDIRKDVPAIKLANMLEGVFTLFIIDCFVKNPIKSHQKSSTTGFLYVWKA